MVARTSPKSRGCRWRGKRKYFWKIIQSTLRNIWVLKTVCSVFIWWKFTRRSISDHNGDVARSGITQILSLSFTKRHLAIFILSRLSHAASGHQHGCLFTCLLWTLEQNSLFSLSFPFIYLNPSFVLEACPDHLPLLSLSPISHTTSKLKGAIFASLLCK